MNSSIESPAPPNSHRLAVVFGTLVLIFCFAYFFELASFPFSLDEEWAAVRKDPGIWIAQGRWGAFLIEKYLFPQASIPFVPPMMFGFACAAAFLMILRMVGRDILNLSLADYASFVFFCAFPTWFFIVEFSSNIGSVGLGLVSGTSGAYLVLTSQDGLRSRRFLSALLVASLLGSFAIATYQTLLFYLFCVCAGCLVVRSVWSDERFNLSSILKPALFLAGSCVFYTIISSSFKYWYSVVETYTYVFFNTGYFLADPLQALLKTAKEAAGFYGFTGMVFHSSVWALPVVLVTGVLAVLFDGKHDVRTRLALLVGAGAMAAAPFALNPFFPGMVLGRTMVATAAAAWFLCYLGVNSRRYPIRVVANVALAIAIAQILILQNRSQASSYFLAKHDLLVATSIYDRLGNAPGFKKGIQYPMAVFGGRNFRNVYPIPATSNAAASFMGPFVGSTHRVRSYMRLLGLEGLKPVTDQELDAVVVRLSKMPIWPAAGSVALENGMLLVRLGRDPGPSENASLARVGVVSP